MTDTPRPLERVQAAIAEARADLLVIGATANLRYALALDHVPVAVERLIALLVTPERAAVVLPDFDAAGFAAASGMEAVFGWADKDGPLGAVADAFAALGPLPADPRCLVDDELPFAHVALLRERLGSLPQPAGELLAQLRLVKDAEEQERLAAAGAMVTSAMEVGLAQARPGMSERELQRIIEAALSDDGAEDLGFVLVQAGANSAAPHHFADETPIRRGEPVLIDIVSSRAGYYADITGQVFLGTPPDGYLAAYRTVFDAQRAGLAAACAGATVHEVDQAASAVIVGAGLGEWNGPRTGHGIGLAPHERPSVVAGSSFVLPAGAAITVEPGVYIPGSYGIRIEDTVIVEAAGPRAVTRGSRDLLVRDV